MRRRWRLRPRDPCVAGGWLPGRPRTDFGRRRPNPGSSPGQVLPLPSERVKSGDPGGWCTTSAWRVHRGSHPHPSPLPHGRPLRNPRLGARKTLTPTLSHGEREQERPRFRSRGGVLQRSLKGEGERAAARKRSLTLARGASWAGWGRGRPTPAAAEETLR